MASSCSSEQMRAGDLTFSRSGDRQKLYGVSPLLFTQDQLNNKYFLPDERDLPAHGLELRFWTFDFGFSNPGNFIGPYGYADIGLPAGRNFLAISITGASVPQGSSPPTTAGNPGAQITPSYLINFVHTHQGAQRQWANKSLYDVEGVGRGVYPTVFKSPVLILQGDTLTCEVQNLANSNLQLQVMVAGGEF
jgi:hypothetical protein